MLVVAEVLQLPVPEARSTRSTVDIRTSHYQSGNCNVDLVVRLKLTQCAASWTPAAIF